MERPIRPVPKPASTKSKGGKSPRAKGDRAEREIGKLLGEKRTVGSGAFKNTNKNLEGDMDVRDKNGKEFIKLEIKYTGSLTTTGEKSYTLTEKVCKQMIEEAHAAGELGALVVHFKNGKKFVLMEVNDWHKLVELARIGNVGGIITIEGDPDNNLGK